MTTAGALASHGIPARHRRWLHRSASVSEVGIPVSGRLFIVGMLLIYVDFLRNAFDMFGTMFPGNVRLLSIVAGPAMMYVAAMVALGEGQLLRLRPTYRAWLALLTLLLACLLMTGVVVFENELRQVAIDFLLFPIVFAGILVGCRRENWVSFDKLFMAIFAVNIVVCVLGLSDVVSAAQVATRNDRLDLVRTGISFIWGEPNVYVFWGVLSVWPYFVLTAENRSRAGKLIAYVGAAVFFGMAAIYQKRLPFLELALFIGIVGLKTYPGRLKVMASLVLFGLLVWFMVGIASAEGSGTFWTKLGDRFDSTGVGLVQTVQDDDRLYYEPMLVLTQFNAAEFVVGRGLGGTVHDDADFFPDTFTHTLHNGSVLLVLKGGVVLGFVWLAGWLLTVADFMRNRDSSLLPYYVPILMAISLFWLGGFNFGDQGFVLAMMCAGRVMSTESFRATKAQMPVKFSRLAL